jgi:hypothetical protein
VCVSSAEQRTTFRYSAIFTLTCIDVLLGGQRHPPSGCLSGFPNYLLRPGDRRFQCYHHESKTHKMPRQLHASGSDHSGLVRSPVCDGRMVCPPGSLLQPNMILNRRSGKFGTPEYLQALSHRQRPNEITTRTTSSAVAVGGTKVRVARRQVPCVCQRTQVRVDEDDAAFDVYTKLEIAGMNYYCVERQPRLDNDEIA